MLRRLYPYWRPSWRVTAAGLALLIVAGLLELLLPWPIKWLVDGVFGTQPLPAWVVRFQPRLGQGDRAAGVAAVSAAILILGSAHKLIYMLSNLMLINAGLRTVRNLRCRVVDHLQRLSLSYHDQSKVGDSIYRAAYDAFAAQALLSQVLAPVVSAVLVLSGILVVMMRLDAVLTLIALSMTPILGLLVRGFSQGIGRRSRRYHEQESALVCTLQETLSSIRVIKAFTRERESLAQFDAEAGRSAAANFRLSTLQLAFSACVGLTTAAATAAAVYIGAHRVLQGRIMLGDILVFLSYLGMLYTPVSAFAQSSGILLATRTQLQRVFEILDTEPAIRDRPGARQLPEIHGHVEFREVEYAYEPGRPVLRGVDLVVSAGKTVAIVGRTGSGKTTLVSLLLRFHDPDSGGVLLDGTDLRDLQVEWLRRNVGLVLQDAVLLSGTIAENIAFGHPGASRTQVEDAARRAQADEFIRALPDGYDSLLGERGVNLSGGQRQRLSIARAFLKDAPILILDEPTSALDAQTESALITALRDLMQGRTTFIIAHRLSTVQEADFLVVMDDGQVAEHGTHDELLERDSLYRQLYLAQWKHDDPIDGSVLTPANGSR